MRMWGKGGDEDVGGNGVMRMWGERGWVMRMWGERG